MGDEGSQRNENVSWKAKPSLASDLPVNRDYRARAASVARSSGSALTGEPVAFTIH